MAYMYCILSKDSNVVCNNVYSNSVALTSKTPYSLRMTTDQTVPSQKSQNSWLLVSDCTAYWRHTIVCIIYALSLTKEMTAYVLHV